MLKFCVFEIRSEGKEKREGGNYTCLCVYRGTGVPTPPSLPRSRERGERERDGRDDGFQPHHHHHSSLNDVV